MGNIFQRSSGRGWRLRQRSMTLWPEWIEELNKGDYPIKIEKPLIKLARSKPEAEFMQKLERERKNLGVNYFTKDSKFYSNEIFPTINFGGLISYNDGRINSIKLHQAILNQLEHKNVHIIKAKAISLNKSKKWSVRLSDRNTVETDLVIISSSLGSERLLKPLNHFLELKPVLGQALELELKQNNIYKWPAILILNNINIIPQKNNKIIIGATLEQGNTPNIKFLEELKSLNTKTPVWLKGAKTIKHWYGIRGRPEGRSSPVLEVLEPGLILATGHYRNGILLAPATAEWIEQKINEDIN